MVRGVHVRTAAAAAASGSLQIRRSQELDEGKYEWVAENSVGVAYSYGANLYVRGMKRHINLLIATLQPQSNGPSYSNTVMGTLDIDGWAVTFGTARRGLGVDAAAQAPPCCTKCNTPPINGQCTNFVLFVVAL